MNKPMVRWWVARSPSAFVFFAFGITTLFTEYEGHWSVAIVSIMAALTLLTRVAIERLAYIIGWHDGLHAAADILKLIERGEMPPDQAPHVEPWLRPSYRKPPS